LASFASEINRLVSKRKHENTANQEAQLLKKIKTTIPTSIKRRQKQLFSRFEEDIITEPERDELILLNNAIEEKTAERIVLMGQLAKLRQVTIHQLYRELSVKSNYEIY
jgi:DNA-binding phage protein